MLKIFIAIIIAIPLVALAADPPNVTKKNITVTGSVYRSCTVEHAADATLNVGDHRASSWFDRDWLDHRITGHNRTFIFNLKDCDAGTTVKISATGRNAGGTRTFWLKNEDTSAPDLYVDLKLLALDSDDEIATLPLDGLTMREVTTVNNANDTTQVKIRGNFRRIDTSVEPVGNFRSTVTIIFTFV